MALIKLLKQIVNYFVLYICCYSNFKDNFLQNYGLKKQLGGSSLWLFEFK